MTVQQFLTIILFCDRVLDELGLAGEDSGQSSSSSSKTRPSELAA